MTTMHHIPPSAMRNKAADAKLSSIRTRTAAADWACENLAYIRVPLPQTAPEWALAAEKAANGHLGLIERSTAAQNAAYQYFPESGYALRIITTRRNETFSVFFLPCGEIATPNLIRERTPFATRAEAIDWREQNRAIIEDTLAKYGMEFASASAVQAYT